MQSGSSLTLIALVPALAAAGMAVTGCRTQRVDTAWRAARWATIAMLVGAGLTIAVRVIDGASASDVIRLDTINAAMVTLIALVGWAVVRYSATYLTGDAGQLRYIRRLLATLAAVSVVVVANHLLVLVIAWSAASVAMHRLLTHFGDRPVALAVAHKKFVLARVADAAMAGAAVAFFTTFDTLRIDTIGDQVGAAGAPIGARVGIFLVALTAVLKCAQLPFHGWLIQVMEAPTPVSALLHAGVVNLGGFVLLRFAPLVNAAIETRVMLVVVGVTTAIVASLVMTTRVSVKVALAWSTCAQMGFMLLQCGLGLWEMALLHLLAHSVYKAHAFLSAGSTVRHTQRARLAGKPPAPTVRALVVGAAGAATTTLMVGLVWQALPGTKELSATVWVMLGIVALALTPLTAPIGRARAATPAVGVVGVTLAYLALHELFGRLIPSGPDAPPALLAMSAVAFAFLFGVQSALRVAPSSRLARRARPWVYAGLFLDDAFTRLLFSVWPPAAPVERAHPLPRPRTVAVVPSARTSEVDDMASTADAHAYSLVGSDAR